MKSATSDASAKPRLHINANATPLQRRPAHDVSPLTSPQVVLAEESVVLPPIFVDAFPNCFRGTNGETTLDSSLHTREQTVLAGRRST